MRDEAVPAAMAQTKADLQEAAITASLIIVAAAISEHMEQVISANIWYQVGAIAAMLIFLIPTVYILTYTRKIANPAK